MLVDQPLAGRWSASLSIRPHLHAQPLDRPAHARRLPPAAGGAGHAQRPDRGDDHRPAGGQGLQPRAGGDRASSTRSNRELRQAATQRADLAGFVGPMMNCVNNLGLAIVAGLGGWMAVQGLATVGTIASFISYSRQFGRPLNDIANLYNTIQAAMAGAERVFEIDRRAARSRRARRRAARPDRAARWCSKTSASPTSRRAGAEATSACRPQPGQMVALVGPTGAGKTTIVNLLTRFYEIDSGAITIDGAGHARRSRRTTCAGKLGIVLQDTFLFAGRCMDNIRYGRLDATDDEVIAAARLANADQFIHRLPQGYDTLLSERGSNLSQGQRQLLAIARAILANPRILILDEATSSVDTRTEQHIQEALLRLMAGRTSFVIAHRLSTIREADQILVIDRGADRRAGHARGTAGAERLLRPTLREPVPRDRDRPRRRAGRARPGGDSLMGSSWEIRPLTMADAEAWWALRLRALREHPEASDRPTRMPWRCPQPRRLRPPARA